MTLTVLRTATSAISQAEPLPGFENVSAGELSLIYDAPLSKYLLFFKDYNQGLFLLYAADTPYGPYTKVAAFNPCGAPGWRPAFLDAEWMGSLLWRLLDTR